MSDELPAPSTFDTISTILPLRFVGLAGAAVGRGQDRRSIRQGAADNSDIRLRPFGRPRLSGLPSDHHDSCCHFQRHTRWKEHDNGKQCSSFHGMASERLMTPACRKSSCLSKPRPDRGYRCGRQSRQVTICRPATLMDYMTAPPKPSTRQSSAEQVGIADKGIQPRRIEAGGQRRRCGGLRSGMAGHRPVRTGRGGLAGKGAVQPAARDRRSEAWASPRLFPRPEGDCRFLMTLEAYGRFFKVTASCVQ